MNFEFDLNKNDFILGGKYKILDIPLNKELNVQIVEINDFELIYKNLDNLNKFQYRELNEINMLKVIEEKNANKINNEPLFSITTKEIKAILGRKEVIDYSKNNFQELNIDDKTCLISITDPKSQKLNNDILNKFKDSLSIQFYDVEDDFEYNNSSWNYKAITNEEAKEILDFILKNKNNNFVIHCEKGQSRSAGVGLAIECIIKFNGDRKKFSLEPSPILNHHRYEPNMFVFNKILEEFIKLN